LVTSVQVFRWNITSEDLGIRLDDFMELEQLRMVQQMVQRLVLETQG
jgi:hypothetical protein